MIRTKKISAKEVEPLIRLAYENDADILATQHVKPFDNIVDAVAESKAQIEMMAAEKNLNYYKVLWGKSAVGYFVTFDRFLFSFGINKEYRKKEALTGWWSWVVKSLPQNFMCLLHPHQTKAINFLRKNGMIVAEVDKENDAVLLIHKN